MHPRSRDLPSGSLWLADTLIAVRALAGGDPKEARAIAQLLMSAQTAPVAESATSSPVPSRSISAPAPTIQATPDPRGPTAAAPRLEPSAVETQLVELRSLHAEVSPPSTASLLKEPAASGVAWPPKPASLFDPKQERALLREACAVVLPSSILDVERWISAATRLELPRRVPTELRRSTRAGICALVDRGPALSGLMQDLDSLGARLGRLFDRAHVLRFMDRPSRVGRGDVHAWSTFTFPPRGTPILVVTALTAKNTVTWIGFAERCKRLDHPLTLIVPQLPRRVPTALTRLARLASWDRRTNVRELRRATRRDAPTTAEHAALLARYAARSAFVDPHLLRELRRGLIPEATAEAELQVWNMRGATAKTAKGFVFEPKRLEQLRAEPVPRPREAFDIIAKAHENASELLQLEDLLVRTSLSGDSVDEILEKVLQTMEQQPHRAKNLASWFARASARFPKSAHDAENAKVLSVVASAHVPHVHTAGAPQSPKPSRAPAASSLVPRRASGSPLGCGLRFLQRRPWRRARPKCNRRRSPSAIRCSSSGT